MMRDDTGELLSDLLTKWHQWAIGFAIVPQPGADPMFRNSKSPRGWDSVDDIVDGELNDSTMRAMDFEIGEIQDPHRSAIHEHARNLASRHAVWRSPRLPTDVAARQVIVNDARSMLLKRLVRAGII